MNAQFKKGVLELCVLAQLASGDKYGYELTDAISTQMTIGPGTLYLLLKRLKDAEYCETYLMESGDGPARKYYRLTESGFAYFTQLKEEWFDFCQKVDALLKG